MATWLPKMQMLISIFVVTGRWVSGWIEWKIWMQRELVMLKG